MSTHSTSTSPHRISARISARIKRQIAAGRLQAGEKLPSERDMARRHKVSRVSVREAYKSLEEIGIVIVRRGSEGGAFIAVPGHSVIRDSLTLMLRLGRTSMREISDAWMIQPTIAQLAARHARAADIARLKRIVEREQAAASGELRRAPHASEFQRALAQSARNLPLVALVSCLADMTGQTFPGADLSAMRPNEIHRLHRSIVDAIERRDEAAAYQLMHEHVGSVTRQMAAIARLDSRRTAASGPRASGKAA
jgi:GntR family transcriptional repressor for pyruvate dehydrogenase complex